MHCIEKGVVSHSLWQHCFNKGPIWFFEVKAVAWLTTWQELIITNFVSKQHTELRIEKRAEHTMVLWNVSIVQREYTVVPRHWADKQKEAPHRNWPTQDGKQRLDSVANFNLPYLFRLPRYVPPAQWYRNMRVSRRQPCLLVEDSLMRSPGLYRKYCIIDKSNVHAFLMCLLWVFESPFA